MKNILVISAFNAIDKNKSSGTPYYIVETIRNNGHNVVIGKHFPKIILLFIVFYYRIKKVLSRYNQLPFMNKVLVFISKYFYSHKYLSKYDLIVAPWGSSVVSGLNTNVNILYITDATLKSMINYNPTFCDLSKQTIEAADLIETSALRKSTIVTVPSIWAYQELVTHYNIDPSKIVLAEYGPNLDSIPDKEEIIKHKVNNNKLRLLFIGKGWYNKGADKAIEVFETLKNDNVNCELYIVGSQPPQKIADKNIFILPLLNKNKPADKAKLAELYKSSHFFILPTRSECFGIVFSEASAYGIPILATDTGGVSNAVIDGKNGFLFKQEAKANEFAEVIKSYWNDKSAYQNLVLEARNCFEKKLNWNVWYNSVFKRINDITFKT